MVPMRDGINLATDLYFPAKDGRALPGPWPTVLERRPYNKSRFFANAPDGNDYARNGYVMVVQDVRGRDHSEGVFAAYPQEGPDGLDTFTWVTEQPWYNGQIVVTGSSYLASTAQAILVQNPPGLAAAAIRVGPGNYHEDGAWRGGAFLLSHNVNYVLGLAAGGHEAAAKPRVEAALRGNRLEHAFRLMRLSPLRPGSSPLALTPSYDQWYQDWQGHELYDDYWKTNGNGFTEHYANAADVPVLLIGEWYDAFLGGTLDQFAGYGQGRQSPVHLIVGGWRAPKRVFVANPRRGCRPWTDLADPGQDGNAEMVRPALKGNGPWRSPRYPSTRVPNRGRGRHEECGGTFAGGWHVAGVQHVATT